MVATAERVGKVARIGGWGAGEVWVIWAMPEFKRFLLVLMASLSMYAQESMNYNKSIRVATLQAGSV